MLNRDAHLSFLLLTMAIAVFLLGGRLAAQTPTTEADDTPALVDDGSNDGPPPPPHAPRHFERPRGDRMPPPVRHYFTQLKKENPAEYERLLKLRLENRDQFMKEMAKRFPRQHDPAEERFRELDRQCRELAQQLAADPEPENAEELREKLAAMVAESVDSMIEQTEQRLEEIQARLAQMKHLRDRIVQQRLDFYLQCPQEPERPQEGEKPPRPAE